ncbi:MAG: UPF0104 family protein [Chloroflexi bacterium]|nr:MAG: UPF0104 family protein [Chloroflexota bacterium]
MKKLRLWIGLIISAVCLYIAFQGLNFADFWTVVQSVNYWWIIPAVAVYTIAVVIRTWRWQAMLRPIAAVSMRRLWPVVVIGYMGNNVYPARAGEVLRSYVLRRREGISMSASLATVVLERLFDGLIMLLFVFVTLPFAPLPAVYTQIVTVFSVVFGVALLFFLVLASRPAQFLRVWQWVATRFLPARFASIGSDIVTKFVSGLQSLKSPREMLVIFASSALIWLTETGKYWVIMQGFPFHVDFTVLMLMTAVVNLATTLPSTPGYAGTFDVPGILVLQRYGIGQAIATGYTLVLHVALWLPITLLGAWYMLREQMSWDDFGRAVDARQGE